MPQPCTAMVRPPASTVASWQQESIPVARPLTVTTPLAARSAEISLATRLPYSVQRRVPTTAIVKISFRSIQLPATYSTAGGLYMFRSRCGYRSSSGVSIFTPFLSQKPRTFPRSASLASRTRRSSSSPMPCCCSRQSSVWNKRVGECHFSRALAARTVPKPYANWNRIQSETAISLPLLSFYPSFQAAYSGGTAPFCLGATLRFAAGTPRPFRRAACLLLIRADTPGRSAPTCTALPRPPRSAIPPPPSSGYIPRHYRHLSLPGSHRCPHCR